jgi:hypothetical protein
MEKAKFYVDFCFEAGDAGLCHRYWFEIEFSDEEFEELYQVWYDNGCCLNSWDSDREGHEAMLDRIDRNAHYAINRMLAKDKPKYAPESVDEWEVKWEISEETEKAF